MMTITFEAVDMTGSLMFTTFNVDSEKLLGKKVEEIYNMPEPEKQQYLTDAETRIRATTIYLQVRPATALSRNGVLKKLAREAAGHAGLYSIKLKVIDKQSIHSMLQNNKLEYETITFEDDEGTNLQCVLHNEEIQMYKDIIVNNMNYEIYNPTIIALLGEDSETVVDQVYQLSFNSLTVVQPIFDEQPEDQTNYQFIASIPRLIKMNERYDVLGILMFVNPNCQVPRSNGQHWNVCEVFIVDQSSEQLITVTAWEGMAIEECRNLCSLATSFPVVAFTSLRAAYRKGFSLSTTEETVVNLSPIGNKAALGETHQELLNTKKQQLLNVLYPEEGRKIITMAELFQKKVTETLQEEEHWLKVDLTNFDISKLQLYLGCSNCGRINDKAIDITYTCSSCLKVGVISTPRLQITFDAADETGSFFFTAYNENAEILLEVEAAILYSMTPQEKEEYLLQIERQVRDNPVYIQVRPSSALARYRKLYWIKITLTKIASKQYPKDGLKILSTQDHAYRNTCVTEQHYKEFI
ncbi:replication protein A 70 kDa DNA-binding subunit B-like [Silene latifolia]|uniref:replication protein A 70 kDa DNA-binding subunit B-like n=1 Tax=Silene latifolia TaxID=37657 RepID=UPI003D77252F